MASAAVAGREDLGWDDEGEGVSAWSRTGVSSALAAWIVGPGKARVAKAAGRDQAQSRQRREGALPKLKKKWQMATHTTVRGALEVCATP